MAIKRFDRNETDYDIVLVDPKKGSCRTIKGQVLLSSGNESLFSDLRSANKDSEKWTEGEFKNKRKITRCFFLDYNMDWSTSNSLFAVSTVVFGLALLTSILVK